MRWNSLGPCREQTHNLVAMSSRLPTGARVALVAGALAEAEVLLVAWAVVEPAECSTMDLLACATFQLSMAWPASLLEFS